MRSVENREIFEHVGYCVVSAKVSKAELNSPILLRQVKIITSWAEAIIAGVARRSKRMDEGEVATEERVLSRL